MEFEEKVVIVSGGAKGIGKEIVKAFLDQGASPIILDVNEEANNLFREEMSRTSREFIIAKVDVSNYDQVKEIVNEVMDRFHKIDILVNNAAIILRKNFLESTFLDWESTLAINLGGTINLCNAVVPYMMKNKRGKIINMSSIVSKTGESSSITYATSKGAINAFTKTLARQLGGFGITVNAIAPHAIESDLIANWTEQRKKEAIASIPLNRMGTTQDIAGVVTFLASSAADFITGEVINVNGGYFMDG